MKKCLTGQTKGAIVSSGEQQYLDLLQDVLNNGVKRDDRTGVGTLSVFGRQLRFDLRSKFPLLTTKRVWFKGVAHELLWLLSGDTNIKYLVDNDVHIWDEWADKNGDLGRVYGAQWRGWRGKVWDKECLDYKHIRVDQIAQVIASIKTNPNSRRHVVSAWNVGELDQMALQPCHYTFQFYVANEELSCMMTMRSCDLFLGCPFNIASYALLTHMIAQVCGLRAGELTVSLGDSHIYLNHQDQVKEQLSRNLYDLPVLKLNPNITNIDDFKFEDIIVDGYKCHPTIKAPIAV